MLPVLPRRLGLTSLHWTFLMQGYCHLCGLMNRLGSTVRLIHSRPSGSTLSVVDFMER